MKLALLFFMATTLLAKDRPVTYWDEDREETPEHWKSFLDMNSINFWKEGDYTPPLPLIWAMKDPTPQNIALYKTYLQKRAEVLETFHQAMKKDRIEHIEQIVVVFRSDCNACHRLLSELAAHGEIVEKVQLLQLDSGRFPSPWPTRHLSQAQAQSLGVQTVPMVWVKNDGENVRLLEHPGQLFEEYL